MAILEYNVDSFFNDIFNRFTKKISEFVYDDELLFRSKALKAMCGQLTILFIG